jgi:hypothetical protein
MKARRQEESSFSEDKEAKRLLTWGAVLGGWLLW